MKKVFLACCAAVAALGFTSCSGSSEQPTTFDDSVSYYQGLIGGLTYNDAIKTLPENEVDKFNKKEFLAGLKYILDADTSMSAGYGLGVGMQLTQFLKSAKEAGVNVNNDMLYAQFSKAFLQDSVNKVEGDSIQKIYGQIMTELNNRIYAAQNLKRQAEQAEAMKKAEANIAAGKEYVEKAKAADAAIKTTESGLAYKVVKEGAGKKPADTDKVKVKYTGKLIDGTTFDAAEEPVEFEVARVVPGFAEALKLMSPGSQYTVYIPANLGYGNQPVGTIPAGSTLVFDVELVEVL